MPHAIVRHILLKMTVVTVKNRWGNNFGMPNKKKAVLLISIMWFFAFIVVMYAKRTEFYYDALRYWQLADSFWNDEMFSLRNYPIHIRGTILPLFLSLLRYVGETIAQNEYIGFRVGYTGVLVLLVSVLYPYALGVNIGSKRWAIGSVFSLGLFLFFWKDTVLCPLSDMIALALYMSVLCTFMILEKNRVGDKIYSLICGLFTGILVYWTYNVRTVYMIPLGVILVLFCTRALIKKNVNRILSSFLAFIGIILGSVPEMIANFYRYGIASPLVNTAIDGKDNLFVAQLAWGLSYSRYETFIGNVEQYPTASVLFSNQVGKQIAEQYPMDSIKEYMLCVFSNFLETIGIYFEHFVSGITLFWNELYITNIQVNTTVFLTNCILFLLAGLAFLLTRFNRNTKDYLKFCEVGLIVFPALIALPGAVEARFFLSIYVLVYTYITMVIDYRELIILIRKHWILSFVFVVLCLGIWLTIANNILCEIELVNLDYKGNVYY